MTTVHTIRPTATPSLSSTTPQVGDRLTVRDGRALPEAPTGTSWKLVGNFDTAPPQYTYELKRDPPRADTPELGERRTVTDGRTLPEAPAGTAWKLVGNVETAPPQYTYELRASGQGPAAPRAAVDGFASVDAFVVGGGGRFVVPDVPVTTMPIRGPIDPDARIPSGPLPGVGDFPVTIPRPVVENATVDLGPANERNTFSKTAELYSGAVTAELVSQRGPMTGSHTATRQTAVSALAFEDTRGFFGGASEVTVELIAQHTLVRRTPMGGHMVEQQERGVLDESSAVRVRLTRGDDGVYRASAGENQAFFVASSDSGYANRILERIKLSVVGQGGVEDTAYGRRYDLF